MSPEERSIRERLEEPSGQDADLPSELERLRRENADLRTIIEELLRRLYGKKSERRKKPPRGGAESGSKPASQPEAKPDDATPGHGRSSFGAKLPRETTVSDVAESERICSTCKEPLSLIGTDVTERGDIQPVRIIVRRHERRKYGCPHGHEVKTGEAAPPGLVDRAKWTENSYAFVVVAKYGDHLPLDRISSILARQGIDLSKSTMVDMAALVAEKFRPVLAQGKKELLANDHLQGDETPLVVVLEGGRGTKQGYLWVYRALEEDPTTRETVEKILIEFDLSRGSQVPEEFLSGWKGTLQTDGYQGYDSVERKNGLRRAGCWAHARRKWTKAQELGSTSADGMLRLMARLWRIDGAVATRAKSDDLVNGARWALLLKVRRQRSRVVVTKIRAELDRLRTESGATPKSPLGKAMIYLENQWSALTVFLDDPRVELDTNATERAIRPIAIGRRNWHIAGSPKGAATAAALFTIVNTCKALGIDPHAYIADVLTKVSPYCDVAQLTPWAWARARRATAAPTPDSS